MFGRDVVMAMTYSRMAHSLLVLSMAVMVCATSACLGAELSVEKEEEFGSDGHVADGIAIVGDSLTLALEPRTYLQKDWTGDPGQNEWYDATAFLSSKDVDGTSPGKLTLGKETWASLADGAGPRTEHVAVWDMARNNMVVFGGSTGGTNALGDAWRYDPSSDSWSQLSSASAGRYWHSGSWDGKGNKVVVHGGMVRSGAALKAANDTWSFDPAADTWTETANVTEKRYGHSSVWDPVRERVLVFGGYAGSSLSSELWAYDPVANLWDQRASAPLGLYEHSAVWAEGTDIMWVFGGLKGGGSPSKDLWAYDAMNDTWVQYGTGATPRSGHAAAWDPVGSTMIIACGHSGSSKYNDTWTYDPSTDEWSRAKDLPGEPRTGGTLVWDRVNDQAILHGGKGDGGELTETWAYSPSYRKKGELVSSAFDVSDASRLVNVSWKESESTPGCVGASFGLQLAASGELAISGFQFSGPDGPSSYYADGDAMDKGLEGKRYIRYKVVMSTTNGACAPVLEEIKLNYLTSVPSGNYTSPAFDTGSSGPNLLRFEYEYDNPGETSVVVYLRSSHVQDMSAASEWEEVGPSDAELTTPGRRYVQFKVHMTTGVPGKVPSLDSFKLRYNSVPQLIPFLVEPADGPPGTEFVFKVMYKDGDGESPKVHQVIIDGDGHDMEPQEYDYRTGANFTFRTVLSSGTHKFVFKFSDGTNTTLEPGTGEFEGPVVNALPTCSLKVPTKATKGTKVKLDASGSTDTDGSVVQYKFDFGDGTDSGWVDTAEVAHKYVEKGKFTVKVHVKDDLGGESVSEGSVLKVEAKGTTPGYGTGAGALALVVAFVIMGLARRKRIY